VPGVTVGLMKEHTRSAQFMQCSEQPMSTGVS